MTLRKIWSGCVTFATTRSMASDHSENIRNGMERTAYDKRSFRNLPRERCEVEYLLGPMAGVCAGHIHLHHSDPDDPDSRLIGVCNKHHQRLHAAIRALEEKPKWKTCNHNHPYPEGKEACERRLNGGLTQPPEI